MPKNWLFYQSHTHSQCTAQHIPISILMGNLPLKNSKSENNNNYKIKAELEFYKYTEWQFQFLAWFYCFDLLKCQCETYTISTCRERVLESHWAWKTLRLNEFTNQNKSREKSVNHVHGILMSCKLTLTIRNTRKSNHRRNLFKCLFTIVFFAQCSYSSLPG